MKKRGDEGEVRKEEVYQYGGPVREGGRKLREENKVEGLGLVDKQMDCERKRIKKKKKSDL